MKFFGLCSECQSKEIEQGDLNGTKKQNKLKIIPLGGVSEIGKNMTVVEFGKDLIIVDSGLTFPDDNMPGVDLVIPDTDYLEKNKEKLEELLLHMVMKTI